MEKVTSEMSVRPPKPRKMDFTDPVAFMRASAAWAERWNVWPWDNPGDDEEYYSAALKQQEER